MFQRAPPHGPAQFTTQPLQPLRVRRSCRSNPGNRLADYPRETSWLRRDSQPTDLLLTSAVVKADRAGITPQIKDHLQIVPERETGQHR